MQMDPWKADHLKPGCHKGAVQDVSVLTAIRLPYALALALD